MSEKIHQRPKRKLGLIRRRESGQGALEFGILVPIAITVLIGMVDVSRLFMIQHILNDTSRDAARIAALGGKSRTQVEAMIAAHLAQGGLNAGRATVLVSGTNAATAEPTTVSITYPAQSVILSFLKVQSGVDLSSVSRMLHE